MAKTPKKDRSDKAKRPPLRVSRKAVPKVKRPSEILANKAERLRNGHDGSAHVLDRLFSVVTSRRDADPSISHSARLLSRGTEKVAQKFGEEAVECLIEAVARRRDSLVGESADVLYHLIVMWVDAGITPDEVWGELIRREGVSGILEKDARTKFLARDFSLNTRKIP